jgi:ABC-type polysaccharide/polyol phosphate transport system ATPase subunit
VSDIVIRAENVGKLYQIGATRQRADTLREAVSESAGAWWRGLRNHGAEPGPRTFWALREVSFEVKCGEVLGVIGRNGSGKSTLLKILSRITEPTTGEVEIRGRVGSLLEVGTGFHPELTGRENVYLNGAILGMRRREIQRKFDEMVDFAEVEQFIDTPVKHYSTGMYMRLAFAVAAHLDPEILLVDEVLAVGDAEFQRKCIGKMDEAARDGRTVLFVGHNMQVVQELCGRALWLNGGRLLAEGDVADVVQQRMRQTFDRPGLHEGLYDVSVNILDRAGKPMAAWRTDEEMSLHITIRGLPAAELPVVVVSCYTVEGAWLFTLQSDMFPLDAGTRAGHELILEFLVTNTAIATCEAYLDVGIREPGVNRYAALYTRVQFFTIVSTMERHYSGAKPLLTLPASMRLVSAR